MLDWAVAEPEILEELKQTLWRSEVQCRQLDGAGHGSSMPLSRSLNTEQHNSCNASVGAFADLGSPFQVITRAGGTRSIHPHFKWSIRKLLKSFLLFVASY